MVVLAFKAPDRAVGVEGQPDLCRPRPEFVQQRLCSSEYPSATTARDVCCRKNHFPVSPTDSFDQSIIFFFIGPLDEFHVHRDHAGACATQSVDHLGVISAGQW